MRVGGGEIEKKKEIERERRRQTETDSDRQRQSETERDRQRLLGSSTLKFATSLYDFCKQQKQPKKPPVQRPGWQVRRDRCRCSRPGSCLP